MSSFHVDADQYRTVAAKLKDDKQLKRAFSKRLRTSARPALEAVLAEGAEKMPRRGGLARHMVDAGRVSLSQAGAGIAGVLSNKRAALGRVDSSGLVRHPLFGRRKHWFATSVPAGTFSEAFESRADEIRAEVARAFDDVAAKL